MLLTEPDIKFLSGVVAEYSGNVISPRQAYMLEQQLLPVAKSVGLTDVVQLVGKMRTAPSPTLSTQVAEAVTINETSFFRDNHPFVALEKKVIPDLITQNQATKELRIWCAACSCGQEPYTIAMIIRESFPQLRDWKVQIVATDLSDEMLKKSKSGEYSQLEVNRGLPVKKLIKFFDRKGSVWQAKQELRDSIEFRRLNLTTPWPYLGQFDIVFIRNVLIYFDQTTKAEILNRVRRVLRPDGYLFIGSAETTIGLGVPFQRKETDVSVCYRPIN
ncbi:MAG: protein-glutamate O-methyltransferase CheR [Mariniblastus sp.]